VGRIGPDNIPIISLPGDPVIAALAFHALVRPVVADMLGRDEHAGREVLEPPVRAEVGSRIIPGRMVEGRFEPLIREPYTLRDLAEVTAIAVHHAGAPFAEVVEWPF
jgi:molybdopterin molybdotransferase